MSSSGTAYYLYCLTPGDCAIPAGAIGVDGQPGVMVRVCRGMGAVFSQVEFKTAGTYFVEVLVDDVMKLRYPVPLIYAPPPDQNPPPPAEEKKA